MSNWDTYSAKYHFNIFCGRFEYLLTILSDIMLVDSAGNSSRADIAFSN